MALDLAQFSNLEPANIGNWPPVAKIIVIAVLCAAVLFAGYWFDTRDQLGVLEQYQQKEQQLKKTFEEKQAKAANLDAYKQQMAEMEESFGTMLRQLPSKTEVADLLVDITQTGLASGLSFQLFKPGNESPKEFYAELPIQLRVTGTYHQFGAFVSGVAALPRIVTLHDISIRRINEKGDALVMESLTKTYRYLEEEEIAAARQKNKKSSNKKRR